MLVLAADLQARVPTVQTEAFCALWSRQMVTDNPFRLAHTTSESN